MATNRVLARNGPQELQQHLWLTTVNLTETGKPAAIITVIERLLTADEAHIPCFRACLYRQALDALQPSNWRTMQNAYD